MSEHVCHICNEWFVTAVSVRHRETKLPGIGYACPSGHRWVVTDDGQRHAIMDDAAQLAGESDD